jgi:malate synthase
MHQLTLEIPLPLQSLFSPEAIAFLIQLHEHFEDKRQQLLENRKQISLEIEQGKRPTFLSSTQSIRESSWKINPIPADLQDRKVEITGPVERKMMINAFNSGASVFMADFEDSLSPTWQNVVEGQQNLRDAVNLTLSYTSPEGKQYALKNKIATLMVRPRGWHLVEKHFLVNSKPISASLFDFGLFFFHNVHPLLKRGSAPYFYLPKLENHLEARLWNDVFKKAQDLLHIPQGTIKATVLLETILAAFEMDEILYELREHSAGLNAGRWDYIFSVIKKFRSDPHILFPDRAQITMTVPFMRAYTELLVKTCHKRHAHAMGGMSAFIPNRKDPEVTRNALEKVREDKNRESSDGFDGTWVAHPDLVPVAMEIFTAYLGKKPNQIERQSPDVNVSAEDLLNFHIPGGKITLEGFQQNISVALRYLHSWLRGTGAVGIFNLMEDVATAEISRAQLWQWVHHFEAILDNGQEITADLFQKLLKEEMEKSVEDGPSWEKARNLLEELVLPETFVDFLTLIAYQELQDTR